MEPLIPATFLTHCGIHQQTNANVIRELTIQTNKLWLTASAGHHQSSTGSYNWTTAHHWFVYVAKDMRVWAYDGDRFLILLEADEHGAKAVPIAYLEEQPPAAVLKRLPRAFRKTNFRGMAKESPPVRSDAGCVSSSAGSRR